MATTRTTSRIPQHNNDHTTKLIGPLAACFRVVTRRRGREKRVKRDDFGAARWRIAALVPVDHAHLERITGK